MFKDKIKQFFYELYPELGRFQFFALLKESFVPKINPYFKSFIRYGLPAAILSGVLLVGLFLGSLLGQLRRGPAVIPPSPAVVTVSPTPVYQSDFNAIKQALSSFVIQFPDPAPPIVDYKIALEDFEDDFQF